MVNHLEPDNPECEVKWALGSITRTKLVEVMEFHLSHLKILKDDAVKVAVALNMSAKLNSGHRTGKGQFSFQCQRRAMPKKVQTTVQLLSFHMLAR